jgi:C4-dicarboxylate-binding protein DctP
MKRTLFTALTVAAFAISVGATSVSAKNLRVTSQLSPKHPITANLIDFKNIVEKKSGGKLTIEIFHSAQLYKDKEVPQAVASGAIDMGTASLTRFAGTIPAVDMFYVPFLLPSQDLAKKASAQGSTIRGPLDAAILKTGARVLWWQSLGGAIFMSKEPINGPADVKGKKVRVFGKTLGTFVEVLGGAPAVISGSSQFLAYQRGTVDAGMSTAAAVKSRKIYEVLNHITITNHASVWFVVIINEKVWKGLTKDEQALINEAGKMVETNLADSIVAKDLAVIDFVRKETKMGVIDQTPAQIKAWQDASKPVVDLYIKAAGPLGQQMVDAAKALK